MSQRSYVSRLILAAVSCLMVLAPPVGAFADQADDLNNAVTQAQAAVDAAQAAYAKVLNDTEKVRQAYEDAKFLGYRTESDLKDALVSIENEEALIESNKSAILSYKTELNSLRAELAAELKKRPEDRSEGSISYAKSAIQRTPELIKQSQTAIKGSQKKIKSLQASLPKLKAAAAADAAKTRKAEAAARPSFDVVDRSKTELDKAKSQLKEALVAKRNYETQLAAKKAADARAAAVAQKIAANPAPDAKMQDSGVLAPVMNPYGYTWKDCELKDKGGATMPFDFSVSPPRFVPECAPDTLYAWRSAKEVDSLVWHAQNDMPGLMKVAHVFYFWRTPLATYGYGTRQIRIKLKPDVKFEFVDSGSRGCYGSRATAPGTVYVSYLSWLDGWNEYWICNNDAIESWSTQTLEGNWEITAEKSWVESHQMDEYDQIRHQRNCNDCPVFHMSITDPHTSWEKNAFDSLMEMDRKATEANPVGSIFFAPGTPASRLRHFQTKTPGYFNPFKAP